MNAESSPNNPRAAGPPRGGPCRLSLMKIVMRPALASHHHPHTTTTSSSSSLLFQYKYEKWGNEYDPNRPRLTRAAHHHCNSLPKQQRPRPPNNNSRNKTSKRKGNNLLLFFPLFFILCSSMSAADEIEMDRVTSIQQSPHHLFRVG